MGKIISQIKKKDFAIDKSNNSLVINQISVLHIILTPKCRPGAVGSVEDRSEDE